VSDSLDYSQRVSDKVHYVSPSRGQLGNGLKCVWAAPLVADGESALIEVEARGVLHRVEVTLDRIAQEPRFRHEEAPAAVKTGTSVRVHWPEVACWRRHRGTVFTEPPNCFAPTPPSTPTPASGCSKASPV